MGGERQDDSQRNEAQRDEAGQDEAADKTPQQGGGKIDDETSKAQEDAARERAQNGGYQ